MESLSESHVRSGRHGVGIVAVGCRHARFVTRRLWCLAPLARTGWDVYTYDPAVDERDVAANLYLLQGRLADEPWPEWYLAFDPARIGRRYREGPFPRFRDVPPGPKDGQSPPWEPQAPSRP